MTNQTGLVTTLLEQPYPNTNASAYHLRKSMFQMKTRSQLSLPPSQAATKAKKNAQMTHSYRCPQSIHQSIVELS